jgi:hypothetical protein
MEIQTKNHHEIIITQEELRTMLLEYKGIYIPSTANIFQHTMWTDGDIHITWKTP